MSYYNIRKAMNFVLQQWQRQVYEWDMYDWNYQNYPDITKLIINLRFIGEFYFSETGFQAELFYIHDKY